MRQNFFYYLRLLLLSAVVAVFAGCGSVSKQTNISLQTLYDYQIVDSQSQRYLNLDQAVAKLKDSDVIFIGELHGHHGSHLLQSQLQQALYALQPNQILSMEQFERDTQSAVSRYLYGEIGENAFIKQSRAWDNYTGSYRPLVEFAKTHGVEVVAANAPTDIVRCVGREGESYLTKLNTEELALIARQPFSNDAVYEAKFKTYMEKGKRAADPQRLQQSYIAQLLRDNTMAESIYLAKKSAPNHQIIHLNGAFHSNEFLGTVGALKRLDPNLKLSVVSPVMLEELNVHYQADDLKLGDLLYLILPLPAEYIDQAERLDAMQTLFKEAESKPCK